MTFIMLSQSANRDRTGWCLQKNHKLVDKQSFYRKLTDAQVISRVEQICGFQTKTTKQDHYNTLGVKRYTG